MSQDLNYYNTFIAVAEDCPVDVGKVPTPRGASATVAQMQFEMLIDKPYVHTQEDVLFSVWLDRQHPDGVSTDERDALRAEFLAKDQACMRASPLPKTHGWGISFDNEGRAALVSMDSNDYQRALGRSDITILKAMRSKRKKAN